ncbi:SRPBCC family protein [Frondihabitans australicus]|uniref:Polyketide cyclase/dehydrase/lipid transport protein n=1 Tax=Frondihabitans australicus TaxID=386892 RepID=A0A495IJS6_9MICO|nr:SRPBCC family protein [Frondihabitans australicus]RKR75375.1 polyketide cyclase/dehydrase/lipid transport protein [Frondihabitans australicus]
MTATVETIGQLLRAENHVIIDRDADAVFDFVADGMNNALWRPAVRSIALERGGDGQVGAIYRQILIGPGRRDIAGDYEITEATRPQELRFRVLAGPVRPRGRYSITARPGGTCVLSFALEVEPRGMARLLRPLVSRTMRDEVGQLWRLKAVVEGDPT